MGQRALLPLSLGVLASCGNERPGFDAEATTEDVVDSSTGDEETGDEETGETGGPSPDVPTPSESCIFWGENSLCPEGEKCQAVPHNPFLGPFAWTTMTCVPAGTASVGEQCCLAGMAGCPVDGPVGADTCDLDSLCVATSVDADTGVCREYCQGELDEPTCPTTGHQCRHLETAHICLPSCDPFSPSPCPEGELCTIYPGSDSPTDFICFPPADSPPGGTGDTCECLACCETGTICARAEELGIGCQGLFCCTELCELDDPDFVCAGPDQLCLPLFDAIDPTYANVGSCRVMP